MASIIVNLIPAPRSFDPGSSEPVDPEHGATPTAGIHAWRRVVRLLIDVSIAATVH
jgi:hypothetical protein